MKKAIGLLVLLASCAVPVVQGEPVAQEAQPLVKDWVIASIRMSNNSSDFYTPTLHPERSYGGVRAQVSRLSHGRVTPIVDYGAFPVIAGPYGLTPACNGNPVHDEPAMLAAACGLIQSLGDIIVGDTLWLQPSTTGFGIPGCAEGLYFSGKLDASGQYNCSLPATTSVVYGVPADGDPNMVPDAQGLEYTWLLTHETLHGLPGNETLTQATSHDGLVTCTSGIISPQLNPTHCTFQEDWAAGVVLTQEINTSHTHLTTASEPGAYQLRAQWISPSNVQTVSPGQTRTINLLPIDYAGSGAQSDARMVKSPRADNRYFWIDYRKAMWIGGCTPGTEDFASPSAPCTTVNQPGVYVWIADGIAGGNIPGFEGHYYAWKKQPPYTDHNIHHMAPLPIGVDVTVEPGVVYHVSSVTGGVASVVVRMGAL